MSRPNNLPIAALSLSACFLLCLLSFPGCSEPSINLRPRERRQPEPETLNTLQICGLLLGRSPRPTGIKCKIAPVVESAGATGNERLS